MRRITEAFVAWCADDSAAARFERTVVQGVLAAVAVGVTTGEWGDRKSTRLNSSH